MSLYIPGSEMPKVCVDCPAEYDEYWCNLLKRSFHSANLDPYEAKFKDCPLIEVPPHGRLVDETQILKLIDEQRNDAYNKTHSPEMTWSQIVDGFEWILQWAATIIPADKDGNA